MEFLNTNNHSFDHFFLISGDKSFTTLLRLMKRQAKKTEVLYDENNQSLSDDLKNAADSVYYLDDQFLSKTSKPLIYKI